MEVSELLLLHPWREAHYPLVFVQHKFFNACVLSYATDLCNQILFSIEEAHASCVEFVVVEGDLDLLDHSGVKGKQLHFEVSSDLWPLTITHYKVEHAVAFNRIYVLDARQFMVTTSLIFGGELKILGSVNSWVELFGQS